LILFFLIFRLWAVRQIKLAIRSAFKRTLIYRIVSYRIVLQLLPGRDILLMHFCTFVWFPVASKYFYLLVTGVGYSTELENIGSRIDMQTHAGSSSTRP